LNAQGKLYIVWISERGTDCDFFGVRHGSVEHV